MGQLDDALLTLRGISYSGSGDWLDESGNSNDFTISGPTHNGDRFTFNGTTDYMELAHDTAFDLGASGELTVMIRFARPDVTASPILMSKSNGSTGWQAANFQDYSRTKIIGTATDDETLQGLTTGTVHVQTSVVDASDIYIYLDGAVSSETRDAGDCSNTIAVRIGSYGSGITFFTGDIYDVAVWDRALTAAEIVDAEHELFSMFNPDVQLQLQAGFDATGPLDTTFTWTDITTFMRGFGTKRGRSHERDTVSAGSARFLLDNADRRFEPDYTSGAYYPNIRPMRPIRLRAVHNSTTYELWRGYIEGFPQLWPAQTDAVVALTAVDAFKVFAWNEITDAEVQELSGTRIGNLLDSAGWPAGARSIDTGDYQVQAHTPVCVPALGELQRIVKTEDGLFFMDGNGDAVFHDNSHRTGASSQGTFNDDGTGLAYIDIQLGYDDLQIWNDITVAAVNTAPQAAEDSASVTEFGRRKLKVFDTLHISAANALTVAQGIRDRYKDPGIRVIAITLDPRYDPTVLWPEVLTRELGDLMTVKRTPPAGGTQISSTVFIEGIDHTADAATRTWRTSYLLSPGT